MLWESGSESWDALDVFGQPTAILVSADGVELRRWFGPLGDTEEAEILELAD